MNENCSCNCKCFTELYFFYWFLVVSCNFSRFAVCFQSFINIACRSTQNAINVQNTFNVHWKFGAYQKWEPAGRIGDFGIFLNGFAKSPRVLRWFWILNECNFSWKIVKYCILSEVCLIKTAPHSTVSPQMWCIKSMKCWFTRTQICWKDFVK